MTNADDGTFFVNEIIAAIGREYGWPDAVGLADRGETNNAVEGVKRFVGVWSSEGLPSLTIVATDDGLTLHVAGQAALPLRPISEATFIAEVVNLEARFGLGSDGASDQLVVRQRGEDSRFVRGS